MEISRGFGLLSFAVFTASPAALAVVKTRCFQLSLNGQSVLLALPMLVLPGNARIEKNSVLIV